MSIDARTLRQTVGQFATGVTVVATEVDGTVYAMTANSFTSLSLDPPLVLFCLGKQTKAGQVIHKATGILREHPAGGAAGPVHLFRGRLEGGGASAVRVRLLARHARLAGSAAAIACQVHAIHEGGDHWIVVGLVVALDRVDDARPLLFYRGRYAALDVPVPT